MIRGYGNTIWHINGDITPISLQQHTDCSAKWAKKNRQIVQKMDKCEKKNILLKVKAKNCHFLGLCLCMPLLLLLSLVKNIIGIPKLLRIL